MIHRTAALALFGVMSCSTGNAAADRTARPAEAQRPTAQAAPVDADRAWAHLKELVGFGPRPAGSAANKRTREYIAREMKALGLEAREQAFLADTRYGDVSMANVIVTLPGTRAERIIIGSHFDTKPEKDFEFVGANDGGSSTALLIELARVLKDQPREFTYELVFFDGEEAWGEWSTGNTFGSRHYVDAAKKDGTLATVKAMILLDMVGERNIQLRQDMSSTGWLNDIVWSTAGRLGHQRTFLAETTAVDDDHIPFIRAGIPAIDLIDLDYPAWHTAGDTLDKIDPMSMKIVGDVVVAALPAITARLKTDR
ncbi:MAG: M28 family peptidase [Acidobacteria bacterium]|nr:M28 family peptidase [Acidobacteriota bacterium]